MNFDPPKSIEVSAAHTSQEQWMSPQTTIILQMLIFYRTSDAK